MGKKFRMGIFKFLGKITDIINAIVKCREMIAIVRKKITQPDVLKAIDEAEAAINRVLE